MPGRVRFWLPLDLAGRQARPSMQSWKVKAMRHSTLIRPPARAAVLDRVFPAACAATFLVLMASVMEAAWLYWR
jgi:hypothetical protein